MIHELNEIPDTSIPDHSILITDVEVSDYELLCSKSLNKTNFCKFKKYKVDNLPDGFMKSDEVSNKVTQFISNSQQVNHDPSLQSSVDKLYKEFQLVLKNEMADQLSVIEHKSAGFKGPNKPYWNENLKKLFKEAKNAQKAYCICNQYESEQKRKNFKDKRNKFDKELKQAKRAHMRKTEI